VDLHSWMIFLCQTISDIALWLANHEPQHSAADSYRRIHETYSAESAMLLSKLDQLHWNHEAQAYQDYYINPVSTVKQFVQHLGYVSLFPFMLGHVPADSPKLEAALRLLGNSSRIWSDYGILSLARDDKLFGKGEDYWRGAIWMNMNYLILSSLHKYGFSPKPRWQGPHRALAADLYTRLRQNVVKNVHREYVRTGYVWEQYGPKDGRGRRSHPFTGWTSLVLLMMAELY